MAILWRIISLIGLFLSIFGYLLILALWVFMSYSCIKDNKWLNKSLLFLHHHFLVNGKKIIYRFVLMISIGTLFRIIYLNLGISVNKYDFLFLLNVAVPSALLYDLVQYIPSPL